MFSVVCVCLAAGLPALAVPEDPADEYEANRRLLASWRADREHYERLRQSFKSFWELPAEQRERMRRLDRALHDADPASRTRLLTVLERYAAWLERLPEGDRQSVLSAAGPERLRIIRELRERQYLERLPSKERELVAALSPQERRAQLERNRKEERQLRRACVELASRRPEIPARPVAAPPKPTRREDFPADIRAYIDLVLWRQIKGDEIERLNKAEGAPWPTLARTILELAEKHPVKLPGPVHGPSHFRELPEGVRAAMPPKDLPAPVRKRLNDLQGRWPEFAEEFTAVARQRGASLPRQLGPAHPRQFEAPVAQFIERTLPPKLTESEKTALKSAEGHWPDYPRQVMDLAARHGLQVPLMQLPGPSELWERARAGN